MKTKWLVLVCVMAGLMILSQGCYTMNQVGTPADVAIEVTNTQNATAAQHFTRTKIVNHFVFGLVSPEDSGFEKLIAEEVKKNSGTRAVNLRSKYQLTFVNGLVGMITFGIYTPYTLTVEGDVVK